MGSITQITKTDAMMQTINREMMVAWINHDLLNRASHDVRKSIALYDEDRFFMKALHADSVEGLLVQSGANMSPSLDVHFWSKGIV